MLVKVIMVSIHRALLRARDFRIYLHKLFSGPGFLAWHVFPQKEGCLCPGFGQAGVSGGPAGGPWLVPVWTHPR